MVTKRIACLLIREQGQGLEDAITISTPGLDFMRDRIFPMEMNTAVYMGGLRAVHIFHDHERLPVARTVTLDKSPAGIRASFRWREDTQSREVKAAFDDGVLGASVEFTVPDDGAVPNANGGYDFVKSTLTGWSFTGNPANPQCVKMFKSLGLWKPLTEDLFLEIDDAPLGKEDKMFFDMDLNQVRTLVEKTLEEAFRPADSAPTPAPNRAFREMDLRDRENRANAERNALVYRVLAKVRGDTIIQREADMALCPCLPPAIAVNLGPAIPVHIRYWPI